MTSLSALLVCCLSACSLSACAAAPRTSAAPVVRAAWDGEEAPGEPGTAVVRLYCARAAGWRGAVAVHSWIALREAGSGSFQILEVMGFGRWRDEDESYIRVREREPTRRYRGGEAVELLEITGPAAEQAIPRIWAAARDYPHADEYVLFPGPNSNTFVSWILRAVPELGVELPPTAIGKDWLPEGRLAARSESGTGGQLSLFGLLGVTVGAAEGVELNLFGMAFGVDLWSPALKLPFLGRLGFRDRPLFDPSAEDADG